MTIPFNPPRVLPQLKDVLDMWKKDIFLTFNCHHLAAINSFNSSDQTVQATINYSRTIVDKDGNQISLDYPILTDVPVVSLCGGATSLTFPIAPGDQALILFNDRDIDNWFEGARAGQLNSSRLHSFSDGIALVGLNDISGYDAVRALLSNGTVKLGINPSTNKVLISNGVTLNALLQELMTQLSTLVSTLSTLTTAMSSATPATVVATIAVPSATAATALGTVSTALSEIATDFGELLE